MTTPARILHLNSMLKGGGTDDQCVKLALALHQMGRDVRIAGPDGRDFSKIIRSLNVPFRPLPREGALKWRLMLNTAKIIRREKITIIHGHHGRDLWPTILTAKLSGMRPKIVLTRHMAKSPSSYFTRQFLLGRVDALVAVSHFVAKVLKEGVYEPDSPEEERRSRPPLLGDISKIRVIHGGIDTDRFRPLDATAQRREWGLEPEHIAFAMVGAYDLPRGKGQREYLEAAARIHTQVPNARFLIIGRGNMEDILRADIERLGLTGKAKLTGYFQDMPQAMNAIDCMVLSAVGTEAFGLVVLEAFACGKPVIASDLDGIPEAFAAANFGRIVKPDSVDEIAAAMLDQAKRPRLDAAEMAALHQRVAGEFSLRALGERTAKLYDALDAR